MRLLALWLLALNPVLWGSFYAICKNALETMDPILFLSTELWIAAIPATVILFVMRKDITRDLARRAVFLGFLLFLAILTSTGALFFTTATNTALFPALNGIMAAVIARIFLRKELMPATWFAAVISGWGVSILMLQSAVWNGSLVGDGIAFLAAFLFTLYIFAVNTQSEVPIRSMWVIFGLELWVVAVLGGLLLFVYKAANPQLALSYSDLEPGHWWAALYVGLATTFLPTAIGLFFQRYVSPVTVAFLYVLEPIWGAVAARLLLGEVLDMVGMFGAALIVLGSIIHTAATSQDEEEEDNPERTSRSTHPA